MSFRVFLRRTTRTSCNSIVHSIRRRVTHKASMNETSKTDRSRSWNHENINREKTIQLKNKYLGPNIELFFKSDPLKIVRASGQYMYDEHGNQYLDCINNVCHVGHCHPDVVKAAAEQMATLNTNCRYLHDNIVLLAEKLAESMPDKLEICYFTNSGSEANDLALRIAEMYTGHKGVITQDHAYHGHVRSVMDINTYYRHHHDTEIADHVHVVPSPDMYRGKYRNDEYSEKELSNLYAGEVDKAVRDCKSIGYGTSAFIAESLQSCGGQIFPPQGYLQAAYKCIRDAGGLCIADEVQTGFGRVGKNMWSFQMYDVVPDIVTIGKPMGNGHPVSALITTREIASKFKVKYFNTFGGNPVSCAIGLAVLDVIKRENLMGHAVEIGAYLKKKLEVLYEKHNLIGDIRVAGMFAGIDLVKDRVTREPASEEAAYILKRLKENYVIMSLDGPYNNVLKFKPPMPFNKSNVERVCNQLDLILIDLEQHPLKNNVKESNTDLKKKRKSQSNDL